MLDVALQKATAIDSFTEANFRVLAKDSLSLEDWTWLQSVKTFLQPFYRATLETQSDTATIDKVLFTMDILIQCLDDALKEFAADWEFCRRIRNAWETFDKYYSKTEDSAFYAAALILHPEYRITYIRNNWKTKWQKPALKQVKDLWISYRESVQ